MSILSNFSGVVAGSLTVSITDPNSYLAGASGGVYALIRYLPGFIFQYFTKYFEPYPDVWGDVFKHKHRQFFSLKTFRHDLILTCSAHLANVVANWAEMEFAALRLITFITLAGEQKHWERLFLKVLSLNDL